MYSAIIEGEETEFGTSGLLYHNNKLMYDRKTETLWHQFRGEPVVGPLAGSGIRLDILPSTLTTWAAWQFQHPDTTVLSNDTGVYPAELYREEPDTRSLYSSYRRSKETMFPAALTNDRLATKEQVFGLTFNGEAKAYPRSLLFDMPELHDTVGGQNVVIITRSAADGPRAYERGDRIFRSPSPDTAEGERTTLEDESGSLWEVHEDALVMSAEPSIRLERLPSRDAYWFGWFAFYPHTEVFAP